MKYISLLMICLICWLQQAPAQALPAQQAEIIQIQANPALMALKEDDYWRNVNYAAVGSAIGNGVALIGFIGLDVAPAFLYPSTDGITPNPNFVNASLYGLALIPALLTPLWMTLWSPSAELDWQSEWHILGLTYAVSFLVTALHSLGIYLFQELLLKPNLPEFSSTAIFYLAAPIALISAILLQSLLTAQGYQFLQNYLKNLSLTPSANQGLKLSYRIDF